MPGSWGQDGGVRNDNDIREGRSVEDALTQRISNWLIEQGLARTSFEDLLAGFCDRLDSAGLALLRGMITMRTLHPSIEALNFTWWRGSNVEAQAFQIDSIDDSD